MRELLLSGGESDELETLRIVDYSTDKDIQSLIHNHNAETPKDMSVFESRAKQDIENFIQTSRVYRRCDLSDQDVMDILKRKFERERLRKEVRPDITAQSPSEFLDDKYAQFIINSEATVEQRHLEQEQERAAARRAQEEMQRRKAAQAAAHPGASKGGMEVRRLQPGERPSSGRCASRHEEPEGQGKMAEYKCPVRPPPCQQRHQLLMRLRSQYEKVQDLSRVERPGASEATLRDLVQLYGGVGPVYIHPLLKSRLEEFCALYMSLSRCHGYSGAVQREVDRMMENIVVELK